MKGTTIFCVLLVLHITIGIRPGYLQDHFTAEPGHWSQWTVCSSYCGRGTKQRTRLCIDGKDLRPCSDEIKRKFPMVYVQNEVCYHHKKCTGGPEDQFGPGPWSQWTACSTSCGRGTRQKTRSCIDQKDLRPCSDEIKQKVSMRYEENKAYVQKEACKQRNCPVDGGWSDWTNWSKCSQSCREGASKGEIGDTQPYRIRSKYCTNPRAAFGGKKCARQEWINVMYYSATGTLVEKGDCESDLPFCPGKEVVNYGHSHGVDKSHHISGPPLLKRGNERRRNTGLDLSPISILNHYG